MSGKKIIIVTSVTLALMLILLLVAYEFKMNYMNVSNVLFLVGITCFFPGLIQVSGAVEIFNSIGYLTTKTFSGLFKFTSQESIDVNSKQFKSYSDYLTYKKNQAKTHSIKGNGLTLLTIGSTYIVLSLLIGHLS